MAWPTTVFFFYCCPAVDLGLFTFLEDVWGDEVVEIAACLFESEDVVVGEEVEYVDLDFCGDIR